jgi:hypothetical protein
MLNESQEKEIRMKLAEAISKLSFLLERDLKLGNCNVYKSQEDFVSGFVRSAWYRLEDIFELLKPVEVQP